MLSLTNIFLFFSSISTFLVIFLIVSLSIFNQTLKGFIYLFGVLIVCGIILILQNVFKEESKGGSVTCNLFNVPFIGNYINPSLSSAILSFTTMYLFLPMQRIGNYNYPLILFLSSIIIIDLVTKNSNKCSTSTASFLGILIGSFFALSYWSTWHMAGFDDLLYFSEIISDGTVCKRPTRTQFKCKVYKNGELVSGA